MRFQPVRSPDATHRRLTYAAMPRVLQSVAFDGRCWVVNLTICSTICGPTVSLRRGRGASFSIPAKPRWAKQCCQRATLKRLPDSRPALWIPEPASLSGKRTRKDLCAYFRSVEVVSRRKDRQLAGGSMGFESRNAKPTRFVLPVRRGGNPAPWGNFLIGSFAQP